jgi:hypothetical protein
VREELHRLVERGPAHAALELAHALDGATDELAGDVRAGQPPRRMLDHVADARLVRVALRKALRQALAEHLLQLRPARVAEMLGEAHHGRGLHARARRDVLDLLEPEVVPMLLDVVGNGLELLAQVVELGTDALQQRIDRSPVRADRRGGGMLAGGGAGGGGRHRAEGAGPGTTLREEGSIIGTAHSFWKIFST